MYFQILIEISSNGYFRLRLFRHIPSSPRRHGTHQAQPNQDHEGERVTSLPRYAETLIHKYQRGASVLSQLLLTASSAPHPIAPQHFKARL